MIIPFLSAAVLLTSALAVSALTDEKIEGTANPEPLPVVDPEKALLATIKYPEGMEARLFAREPDCQNPTAIAFDEQNRLYIAETHRFGRGIEDNRRNGHWVAEDFALETTAQRLEMYKRHEAKKPMSYYTEYAEKIRVIEDRDGDGKCDHARVYADGFNDPLDGTAAGVMALGGKVYFACIPHVWVLEDKDGDLVADTRDSLQEGYGLSVSLSGHDLNGFALGPDGRIYFTIGDRGYNLKTKEGKQLYDQYGGAAFRMERDGSGLELVHAGLRNPKEVAFDRDGNLFSVDNNADMTDAARVVDILEGGYSGWQRGHQAFRNYRNILTVAGRHQIPWMEERQWDKTGPSRPMAILPPAAHVSVGPSGLAYNPGTGLGEKWDDHFFVCDFKGGTSEVIAFRMAPDGAGFKLERQESFVSGLLNTDVEFGYDGKMYISDYVGSWTTYGFGNIFSFEDKVETAKPETRAVKGIFASGIEKLAAADLAKLLRHPDMRVRLRAQLALAGSVANRPLFVSATGSGENPETRLHGVWGLGNLARLKKDEEAAKALVTLCGDPDGKVRGQAAKALGDAGYKAAVATLTGLLKDPEPRTRMLAASATGKLGDKTRIPSLMELARDNADKDAYLRHGAVDGMFRIGDADAVFAFANDDSPAVRLAAVLALRRFGDPRIGFFLNDKELVIAIEAAQAINDAYIEGARGDLAGATHLLGKSTWMVDVRILNAMFRTGGDENVRRILGIARNEALSENVRAEAVFLLNLWETPPAFDPTTGMRRPFSGDRNLKGLHGEIQATVVSLLKSAKGDALAETLKAAGLFGVKVPLEVLLGFLTDANNKPWVRVATLKQLEADKPDGFSAILEKLVTDKEPRLSALAFDMLGRCSPRDAFEVSRKILSSGEPVAMQRAIAMLANLKHPDAPGVLLERLKNLGQQPAAIQLDVIEAAAQRPELKEALAAYEAGLDKSDPLAGFRPTLEGGNVESGKNIAFNNGTALCTQCHKIGGTGGEAGPNLAGIGGRGDAEYILQSIVDPSAKLAPGYSPIAITMKDGSIVAGMLMKDTETEVMVRNIETQAETICKKSDIAVMPPAVSTMPPMGAVLKKKEIRDLVAYLSSLR